jgi:hypothetical protein
MFQSVASLYLVHVQQRGIGVGGGSVLEREAYVGVGAVRLDVQGPAVLADLLFKPPL